MTKHNARAIGFREGFNAGQYCEVCDIDRSEACCDCEDGQECEECLSYAAFQSEQNARDFSPWEFIAHEINSDEENAEELWESYDAGVAAGIKKAVRKRLAIV